MRFLLCVGFIILFQHQSVSQISKSEFTKEFALQVKTIDDFFDRFNFRENTSFRNYINKEYPQLHYTRKNFVPLLFNQKGVTIAEEDKNKFVTQVIDSINPKFLSYSDTSWFAELSCSVTYLGKPKKMTLIMKVESEKNNMYSWTIVSAKADFLKFKATKADSVLLKNRDSCCVSAKAKSATYFLTPISHGIDFTNVDNVFLNKAHINDYIYKGPRTFELCKLISLAKQSKVKFGQIDDIAYYLFQVDGWIMKIDYFNRNDYNSGWLISQLIKVNNKEKDNYKLKNLNIAKK